MNLKLIKKGTIIFEDIKYLREKRIKERKDKTGKILNEEIFQYLNDTNSRLEEIYDLVKALS